MSDIFSDHVGHVGLYLVDVEDGVELRCFARTHGGNDVVLANVSQLHAQAAQAEALQKAVNEARELIARSVVVMNGLKNENSTYELIDDMSAWLAAHAPAQMCKCGCGCGNVATTDDGSGRPMCESCRRDYLGIPPQ